MKLAKPPIIQAWIEFRFDSSSDHSQWDFNSAAKFFDQFQEEYPEREVAVQHLFQIEKVKSNQKPQITEERVHFHGIRCSRSDRTRYLQLTHDTLACNFLRTNEKGYEGFEALKKEALTKLWAYCDYFKPIRLNQFALQYVDLVRIPYNLDGRIELKDYFTLGHDLPEDVFGPMLQFLVQYTTRPPDSKDMLEFRLWSELPDPEGPTGQFRMDWRLMGFEELGFSEDILCPRLGKAHDRILDCFRKSFTEKAWEMFEPTSNLE